MAFAFRGGCNQRSRAFDHDWRFREFGDQVHYEIASLHITSKTSSLTCRGLAFDGALDSGILLLHRESDGAGIGLPTMRRSAAIEPFDAAFLWLIAKGGHILPPL